MNNNELTYNELQESDLIPHKWCSIDKSDPSDPEICFKLKVWKKQCEFGKKVLNYVTKLRYGLGDKNCLDNLYVEKYKLENMNRIDPKKEFNMDNPDPVVPSNAEFLLFGISGQSTLVEVGTVLSETQEFVWSIGPNGNTVGSININDITNNNEIATNIPNNGSRNITSYPIVFDVEGKSQSWRAEAVVNSTRVIKSNPFTIKADYLCFWGPTSFEFPNILDGVENRQKALELSTIFKSESDVMVLQTGTVETNFVILLPPNKEILTVIDSTNLNMNLTNDYVRSTIVIKDLGGNDVVYNKYTLTLKGPYINGANHVITTN